MVQSILQTVSLFDYFLIILEFYLSKECHLENQRGYMTSFIGMTDNQYLPYSLH